MSAGVALLVFILAFVIFSMLLKVPVPFGLAIASLFVFLGTNMNPITVAQYSFASLDSFALLAIPFYIFAGVLMEYSGISKLVVNWIQSIIGRIRGSLGIICTVTCMAFGVLTGSAMATISAIGKVMAPEMDKDGYPKSYTAALLAATCFLGILIPPSVPGIMYALASDSKISDVWMATVGPALVFMVGYIIVNYLRIGCHRPKGAKVHASVAEYATNVCKTTVRTFPALLMPIIIYGCIYGGICTPTEAGALSAVYGIIYFIILKIIDRKAISISLWEVAAISGASTAAIGLLNAFSTVAGKAITMAGVSNFLSDLITSNINSRAVFLLMINILFLFLGMFLNINAAVLIMTPLLLPVAKTYGITAVHFGAILLVNMSVGFMTPPFALGTFVGTKITGAGYGETVKESIPFMIVGLVAIIITTCFPEYVMFFVNILS